MEIRPTKTENVFLCTNHDTDIVVVSAGDTLMCKECKKAMVNAGWFESFETKEKT